jgi:thiol-disulfide isomerase/thioredoxin
MTRCRMKVLLALALFVPVTTAAEREVKIGSRVDPVSFKDIRYLPRSLDDFPDSKAFVLVFTNTTCPLVQRYLPALARLETEYRSKGVQFLAVNVSADDSIAAMAAQAVRHEVPFPFVKDFDAACARSLGVKRTPEAVILDGERRLRYRGRIDDQYRLGGARPAPSRHDLKEALDAVLAGKEVKVKETPVDGCLITVADLPAPKNPVTFAEHVAPILHKHCVECHRPGTAAPFSLLTYRQVAVRADTVAEVVREQRMPPWYGAPEHTEFVNHRGLTARERETILQWVKGGLERGAEAKLPRPPAEVDRWQIGKPDLIVPAPEQDLPADGVVPYKYVFLPHVFLEETWVQGVQILPDNPRVLHHCNMAWVRLGEGFKISNFITGAVPGGDPMRLDNGVAYRIPKGATLVLQVHYVTTGKLEKCRIRVGFRYAVGKVQKQLRFVYLMDNRFAIPPGAPAHRVGTSRMLDCDAVGVGLFSHMHLRGRDMTFRAHYPDGRSETLLVIPNYNFDWQQAYRWEPGKKRFPKGTRLECFAHYDNSTFNPYNPDPKATVREGQQTHQEMMNGFFFYTDAGEKLGLDIDGKTGRVRGK